MKKIILSAAFFAIFYMLAVGSLLTYKEDAQVSPELVLRYADDQPGGHPTTKAALFFAELVYNKTGGRIRIEVCENGELGDGQSVVEQVVFGGIDFARVSLTAVQNFVPSAAALQIPYSYSSATHMWAVLDGELGDSVLSELQKEGIIGLSWYDAGARSFYSSRPIYRFSDVQPLTIGIPDDAIMRRFVSEIGASSKNVIYSDIRACLQAGIVDAAENNIISYQSTGHYQVAPYFLKTEHLRIPDIQIASQSTWMQISQEDREIIRRCAKESAQYERALWRVRETEAEKELARAGCIIVNISAAEMEKFRQSAATVYAGLPSEYRRIFTEIQLANAS